MTTGTVIVSQLISLIHQLSTHLEKENALIRDRRPSEISALHTEKIRLVTAYEQQMAMLARNKSLLETVDRESIDELRALSRKFDRLLAHHNAVVAAAKVATEGIVKAISDEVTKRNNPVAGYGSGARERPRVVSRPTSIALDQSI